jgi:hypothetical protein
VGAAMTFLHWGAASFQAGQPQNLLTNFHLSFSGLFLLIQKKAFNFYY